MKLNYFKLLDKIGNSMGIIPVHLSRSSMVENSISTGSLVCDLIIGGGWPAGRWITLFGREQSCKSTLLYHTLDNAIKKDVNAEFADFEGSTDPTYLSKIIKIDLTKIFGVRKEKGAWDIVPLCRYYQSDLGEPFFRYIHRVLKVLPDKLEHKNKWYYVYDDKPKKEEFDKDLYKNTKRYWVPTDDGGAQVVWFIDSLPAMLSEKQDEKDDNKEIGLSARMFSRYIPMVKSRLARKRCSVVAVNQIRFKPMAWGNPEYEMCGEAPKLFADIRLQCRSISNPFGKGQIVEEPCWDGVGIDRYRYIKVYTIKNKCFSPYRESLMRVWIDSKGESGSGLDPVFDVYQYLVETGQIEEKKKKITIKLPGIWKNHIWDWNSFKELILNPNKLEVYIKYNLKDPDIGDVDININNKKAKNVLKTRLDIYEACKQQIKTSEAYNLYFNKICSTSKKEIKTCATCANFHKHENCMEVELNDEACEDWISEEEQLKEEQLK